MLLDGLSIAAITGILVNLLVLATALFKGARWSGGVDATLEDIREHLRGLPCRRCGARDDSSG